MRENTITTAKLSEFDSPDHPGVFAQFGSYLFWQGPRFGTRIQFVSERGFRSFWNAVPGLFLGIGFWRVVSGEWFLGSGFWGGNTKTDPKDVNP